MALYVAVTMTFFIKE